MWSRLNRTFLWPADSPHQRASNAECVFSSWRHNEIGVKIHNRTCYSKHSCYSNMCFLSQFRSNTDSHSNPIWHEDEGTPLNAGFPRYNAWNYKVASSMVLYMFYCIWGKTYMYDSIDTWLFFMHVHSQCFLINMSVITFYMYCIWYKHTYVTMSRIFLSTHPYARDFLDI